MDRVLLKNLLNSGSSRVFNCNAFSRRIRGQGPLLFRTPFLNDAVFIRLAGDGLASGKSDVRAVDTLLYFPYDGENAREGGRSVTVGAPNLDRILREFGGDAGPDRDPEGYLRDRALIDAIDTVPSLDPFLLRERLNRDGFAPDDRYFDISETELDEIRDFISGRFQQIVDFVAMTALNERDAAVRRLVSTLWEGTDLKELQPLISALGLDPSQAADTLYAWKGIIFFEFQYMKQKGSWVDFARWVNDSSRPLDFIQTGLKMQLDGMRKSIAQEIRALLNLIQSTIRAYVSAFEKLFVRRESAADFLKFLQDSNLHFWSLGTGLMKMSHVLEIWNQSTSRYPDRRLKYDPLTVMLDLTVKALR